MKSAVIFYHSNIHLIYPQRWIDKCVASIAAQTYKDFDIIELNYGKQVTVDMMHAGFPQGSAPKAPQFYAEIKGHKHIGIQGEYANHIEAMNYVLNYAFNEADYDIVFNTNMDDFFHPTRFEKQVAKINEGFDLVSSDFCYIEEREAPQALGWGKKEFKDAFDKTIADFQQSKSELNFPINEERVELLKANLVESKPRQHPEASPEVPTANNQQPTTNFFDEVTHHMRICQFGDISTNLKKDHNIIAHPCVAYSKTFWTSGVQYRNLLGKEDLDLWQRTIGLGKKFCIIDEELLFYRIHKEQVGRKHKA